MINELVKVAESQAKQWISQEVDPKYVFHDLGHTQSVVDACKKLAVEANLGDEATSKLLIAAWFHDNGYSEGPIDHEMRGAAIAWDFLAAHEVEESIMKEICDAILATKISQQPFDKISSLLCDADLSHLGDPKLEFRNDLLRNELQNLGTSFTDEEWLKFELGFMRDHQYHTDEAQNLYGQNRQLFQEKLEHQLQSLQPVIQNEPMAEEIEEEEYKKEKLNKLGRGVETMYKVTYETHLNLNSLADNKAHIMLTVNSIIFSSAVSFLIPKWDQKWMIFPSIVLLGTALLSGFYAILTIKPKIIKGGVKKEDVLNKTADLLFFSNYTQISIEDYEWAIRHMIKDPDYVYKTMTRTLYFLGQVLTKKYKFLNLCYSVFIYGLLMTVIFFLLFWLMYK